MAQYSVDDLLYLMQRLRHPETGCPWDIKQDFIDIVPHTIEEAYEVADAIERGHWSDIEEELGDLLFQVIFYAQMGAEQKRFDLSAIVSRLVEKLIRRHPHVFPDGTLSSQRAADSVIDSATINRQWQQIKAQEKQGSDTQQPALLDTVTVGLPPLVRAVKLQKKAATVGFDWPESQAIIAKIREELAEVEEAMAEGDPQHLESEVGDLIFAVTNLARHHNINPETALRGTNTRFYQRFNYVEQKMSSLGGWQQVTIEQMEEAWVEAKKIEKEASSSA